MKVNGNHPQARIERVTSVQRPTRPEAPASPAPAAGVQVSGAGRRLAAARAPEVPDEAKISEMRARIADGRLGFDAGKVADAMLREER